MKKLIAIVIAGAMVLASQAQAQSVRVEGPAALEALSRTAAEEFLKAKRGVAKVETGVSGTAGALRKLCRGETDIAGATRPIQKTELEACAKAQVEFIELPIAFDALAIVVHPRNTFLTSITLEELRKMWQISAQGSVTRWNEVNPAWPNSPLTLLGPDPQSDEARYFNEAILGAGKPARADTMSSDEDEVLAEGVMRSVHALTYVSLSAYLQNRSKLKAVSIAAPGGAPIAPSIEAVTKGAYKPLSRPLFYYVAVKSLERPEVRAYVEFLATEGARLVRASNLAPLAEATYRRDLERVRTVVKGTAWEGAIPVGLTIESLQKKYGVL